jgi:iron complex outermembrane receptor protein
MKSSQTKLLLLVSAASLSMGAPAMAFAQTADAPQAASSTQIEQVVVTSRTRSEDVLKIPGNITAITSNALQQRGLTSLDDIAKATPGMADNQASGGSARSDRSFQSIIIRGMTPSVNANPTTSIFINGVPVVTSDMVQSLSSPERIEVLKGPQSAYFGRETFAGAINVITKQPTNHLQADLSAEIGTRNTYIVQGEVSGPIIADKLMATIGGKYDTHDGSYKNGFNPSELLGSQSTKTIHAGLTFKPTDKLTFKVFGMYLRDEDGPAATGIYLSNAGSFSQGNCVIQGTPFFCGTLPGLNYTVSPAQNTLITPTLAGFLAKPGGILNGDDVIHKFGLKRDAYHGDFTAEYQGPAGLTFTNLFGFNQDNFSELSDLSNLSAAPNGQYPGYVGVAGDLGFPYMVQQINQNISEEFRIATDATKRYRGLVGVSYIDNHTDSTIGASAASMAPTPGRSHTLGVFFSMAYDFTSKLTLNFDGRWQDDHQEALSNKYAILAAGDSYAFLPRVSLQYKFTPDDMVYFTYSQGANPGTFNTTYANLPAASKAKIAADGFSVGVTTLPELITNYEIGIKGRFLDGRATLSADIYYDEWTQQLNSTSYVFAASDPANPINIPGSTVYNPTLQSANILSFTANGASTNPKGIEFEGQLLPIEHVSLNAAASYNDTRYTSFICTACAPYTSYNAKGKYLPFAPLFSANFGAMYSNTIHTFARPMDWFVRMDYIHRDGIYVQASNTVKTPAIELVNLRGGITLGKGFSIEGYVKNLTNNKSPVSGFQAYNDAAGFTNTAIDVGLPQLITGGVVLRYKY